MSSKSIEAQAVFTKTEMNNEWNVNFLLNTKCVQKGIEDEAVFTKTKRSSDGNLLDFNTFKLTIFPIDRNASKLLFWYGEKLHHNISLMPSKSSDPTLEMSFRFNKQEKVARNIEGVALAQSCVSSKTFRSKSIESGFIILFRNGSHLSRLISRHKNFII